MALINTTTTGVLGSTFYGDGSGSLTVQKDGVTQGIYGNIPAFSAYANATTTPTTGTNTKVAINTKIYDTNNNYDTTNYRFTPTVAGYYLTRGVLRFAIGSASTARSDLAMIMIFQNGQLFLRGTELRIWSSSGQQIETCTIVYMNGTTDYLELYGRIDGTSLTFEYGGASAYTSQFSAVLVKAA